MSVFANGAGADFALFTGHSQVQPAAMNFLSRTWFLFVVAIAIAGTARADTPLRVVSYNIHAGRGMDKQLDLARTADVLRRLNADVILLQEVDLGTKRSGSTDQPKELGKLLGMHSYFGKAMNYGGGEYGNAVLSKLPFTRTSTLALPGGIEPRSAAIVEVALPKDAASHAGLPVILVSVHLDHRNRDTHMEHAKMVSDEILRLLAKRPAAAIWAGDFNATGSSPIWGVLRKQHGWTLPRLQEAPDTGKATFPSTKPTRQIDWFLYRASGPEAKAPALSVLQYNSINETMASDHCPVLLVLQFGEKKD